MLLWMDHPQKFRDRTDSSTVVALQRPFNFIAAPEPPCGSPVWGTSRSYLGWGQSLAAHESKSHRNGHSDRIESLNDQAERCRRLAAVTYNREVSDILGGMAEDYERTASKLAKDLKA